MVAINKIRLPHKFEPRGYQLPFLRAMDNGKKRAICVWHRRAGKDKTFLNFMIKRMFQRRGQYYYYFPTMSQGRKILWDGIDRDGFKFLEHFPRQLVKSKNATEMKIELINGSLFNIVGTDRLEVVGPNPIGCVFSEYSLQNPRGWDYVRPILAQNEGWAVFNFTPRGRNDAWKLFTRNQNNPKWFCEVLTVNDTHAISLDAIEDERRAGMSADMIEQEFYCSFELGAEGSYYAKLMSKTRNEGRITKVGYDESVAVHTFWDIGVSDSTAIWFAQFVGQEIHLIDYYENQGYGLKHYLDVLAEKRINYSYTYGKYFGPHDIEAKHFETGLSTRETARRMGIEFEVVPIERIMAGIEQVRGLLSKCWFDEDKCEKGIDALENYRRKLFEKEKVYSDNPLHDWSSHAADAFRYMAMTYRNVSEGVVRKDSNRPRQEYAEMESSVLG